MLGWERTIGWKDLDSEVLQRWICLNLCVEYENIKMINWQQKCGLSYE